MLQFITHNYGTLDELQGAEKALIGGCRWIQLRMKDADRDDIVAVGRKLRQRCDFYGARLIIDDHVDIVKEIGADGVHLGKKDMAPDMAREILGDGYIIGGTANTFDDIRHLAGCRVDYIGLGPFRFTTTKKNLSPILGLDGYRHIMRQCRQEGIDIPVVAIGGITRDDIPAIMECGVNGIALSGTLLHATDMVAETKEILKITE